MDKLISCDVQVGNSYKIVSLLKHQYNDGNLCILAFRVWPDEETECTPISVNLPDDAHLLEEDEFFLKNWNEDQETAEALIASGVIIVTDKSCPTGFVRAPVVKIRH